MTSSWKWFISLNLNHTFWKTKTECCCRASIEGNRCILLRLSSATVRLFLNCLYKVNVQQLQLHLVTFKSNVWERLASLPHQDIQHALKIRVQQKHNQFKCCVILWFLKLYSKTFSVRGLEHIMEKYFNISEILSDLHYILHTNFSQFVSLKILNLYFSIKWENYNLYLHSVSVCRLEIIT